jgi:hypothetical protein
VIEVSIDPGQLVAGRESALTVRFTNVGDGTCSHIVFKIGLPPEVLLLRGRDRIEIPKIRAGENYSYDTVVRPRVAGTFTIDSGNFAYRNNYGREVRVPDFLAELTVLPAAEDGERKPPLHVEWMGRELPLEEYDVLELSVRNEAEFPLRNLVLTISGPIRVAPPGPQVELPTIAAGGERRASFVVFPEYGGRNVPVHVHARYLDDTGRTRGHDEFLPIVVRRQTAKESGESDGDNLSRTDTILYLAASPTDMTPLRSDKEMKQVREQVQLGRYRDRFQLEFRPAVGLKDVGQALVDCNPRIVHFSGHGKPDGSLYVEDDVGLRIEITSEGLADLFGLHASTVECIIVNACHSMALAEAMAKYFGYVIGMRSAIGDAAAVTFSIGFYQGLAGGADVPAAFDRGCAFLRAQPLTEPEYEVPVLLTR